MCSVGQNLGVSTKGMLGIDRMRGVSFKVGSVDWWLQRMCSRGGESIVQGSVECRVQENCEGGFWWGADVS